MNDEDRRSPRRYGIWQAVPTIECAFEDAFLVTTQSNKKPTIERVEFEVKVKGFSFEEQV